VSMAGLSTRPTWPVVFRRIHRARIFLNIAPSLLSNPYRRQGAAVGQCSGMTPEDATDALLPRELARAPLA
jgi:hypothetical protein